MIPHYSARKARRLRTGTRKHSEEVGTVRQGRVLTVDSVNVAPEPPRLTNKAVGTSPAICREARLPRDLYLESWLGSSGWVQVKDAQIKRNVQRIFISHNTIESGHGGVQSPLLLSWQKASILCFRKCKNIKILGVVFTNAVILDENKEGPLAI